MLCGPGVSSAGPPSPSAAELKALRARIAELQRVLAHNAESKASTREQLRKNEQALADANRRLAQLAERQRAAQADLARIEQASGQLVDRIGGGERQLATVLDASYTQGLPDGSQPWLADMDTSQSMRDREYLARLATAQARQLVALRATLDERRREADDARAQQAELAASGRRQNKSREALLAERKQHEKTLASLDKSMTSQRDEMRRLQADEQRLAQLIAKLARKPRAATLKRDRTAPPPSEPARAPTSASLPAGMRGKLRMPLKGEIVSRFGNPRADGGTTWKGIFIRAAQGSEVRAAATGQVVFADWLRGFGKLLIVDHGSGLLSIYGNNDELNRKTGEEVQAGDRIATVGSSNGGQETGLYFELRQQGQPIDPLKWIQ